MPSIFSHAIVAGALGTVNYPRKELVKYFLIGLFCATFPDFDVMMFKLGIPYEHPFGHRGFFHSLLFMYLQGLFLVRIFYFDLTFASRESLTIGFYFFCCGVSHSLLDAMTNGGLGVAFFAPFDDTRYFFPWRPIEVSPIGMDAFFTEAGLRVLKSELVYVMVPSAVVAVGALVLRKVLNRGS